MWQIIFRGAQSYAGLVLDVTKLRQRIRRDVGTWAKNLSEQKVKRIDQRLLAAKIQWQRLMNATFIFNRQGHLAENVDICAAKSIYRLFAIANDEKIRAADQTELDHQVALQAI